MITSLSLPNNENGDIVLSLDLTRGGCVGSILHKDQGELVVNDRDGRGIGSSGIVVHPGVVLCECGSHLETGNNRVGYKETEGKILVSCQRTRNWNTGITDEEESIRLGRDINLDITHQAEWVDENSVQMTQWVHNRGAETLISMDNNGYLFPIFPQAHWTKGFVKWKMLYADKWYEVPVRSHPGWLHRGFDLYRAEIDSVAGYRADGFGMAIEVDAKNRGWYVKGMATTEFVGSVWDLGEIEPGESIKRNYLIMFGTESEIEQ